MALGLLLRLCFFITAISVVNARIKILQTNDDGWAVANIRAQHTQLIDAGFDIVMSAPAENESGTGSSDALATPLGSTGCEFESCPPDAPATGFNASNPRLNYVNSFPVTSVRFGIQEVAPKFFKSRPDFVVSGPNVGNNLGNVTLISGTVGAACEAAKEGVPSVALSGDGGAQVSFTTLNTSSASTTTADVFAVLGRKFTEAILTKPLIQFFDPILPRNVTINVNYPGATGECTDPNEFKFILSRINAAATGAPSDVRTCGTDRLPTESGVVATTPGCFVSVSVMDATNKMDVDAKTQAFVLTRLGRFLTCLPA